MKERYYSPKDLHSLTGLTIGFWEKRRQHKDGPPFTKLSNRSVVYEWEDVEPWLEEWKKREGTKIKIFPQQNRMSLAPISPPPFDSPLTVMDLVDISQNMDWIINVKCKDTISGEALRRFEILLSTIKDRIQEHLIKKTKFLLIPTETVGAIISIPLDFLLSNPDSIKWVYSTLNDLYNPLSESERIKYTPIDGDDPNSIENLSKLLGRQLK